MPYLPLQSICIQSIIISFTKVLPALTINAAPVDMMAARQADISRPPATGPQYVAMKVGTQASLYASGGISRACILMIITKETMGTRLVQTMEMTPNNNVFGNSLASLI